MGGGTPRCTDELSLFGIPGGNGSLLSLVDGLGVVWALFGPRITGSHRRRGPDSPVLDVLSDDEIEESTLDWRRDSGGSEGWGEGAELVDGLGAAEGRDWSRLPGAVGAESGGAWISRWREFSNRGGRRPAAAEGGSLTLLRCPV
jgi:hypothetical protein